MARPLSSLTKLILSLPPSMPVSQVVDEVKKRGMETSASNVVRVRAQHGKKGAKPAGRPAAPAQKRAAPAAGGGSSSESTFRRMVLDLGVRRAKEIVDDVERKIAAIVGG